MWRIEIELSGVTPMALGRTKPEGHKVFVKQPTDDRPRLAPGDVIETISRPSPGSRVQEWTLVTASGRAATISNDAVWSSERYALWFEQHAAAARPQEIFGASARPPTELLAALRLLHQTPPTPTGAVLDEGALEAAAPRIDAARARLDALWKKALAADPHGTERMARAARVVGLDAQKPKEPVPLATLSAQWDSLMRLLLDPASEALFRRASRPQSPEVEALYGLGSGSQPRFTAFPPSPDAARHIAAFEDKTLGADIPPELAALYAICGGLQIHVDPAPSDQDPLREDLGWLVLPPTLLAMSWNWIRFGRCGRMQFLVSPDDGTVAFCPLPQETLAQRSWELESAPVPVARSIGEYLERLAERGGRPVWVATRESPPAAPIEPRPSSERRGTRWDTTGSSSAGWLAALQWANTALSASHRFAVHRTLVIEPPRAQAEFEELAAQLPCAWIPPALAAIFTELGSAARFSWSVSVEPLGPLRAVYAGGSDASGPWDIEVLREYAEQDFAPFFASEGDLIGVSLKNGEAGSAPVIFVGHEGSREQLAPDLVTFMTRWTALACPAPYAWAPFLDRGGLVASGDVVESWLAWIEGER